MVGIEKGDEAVDASRMVDRLLSYRVFADDAGRMNLSLLDVGGGLLLVPQFTLAADTSSGTRPGFSTAAAPEDGRRLFDLVVDLARSRVPDVQTGVFGAHMRVALVNDGPVTFWLQSRGNRQAPSGA